MARAEIKIEIASEEDARQVVEELIPALRKVTPGLIIHLHAPNGIPLPSCIDSIPRLTVYRN